MMKKIEHAIILAAGLGTRLKPLTDHSPKCLTEVNGRPILVNTLENLAKLGIRHCTIVTGYLQEKIAATVKKGRDGLQITCTENDVYGKTNDMYSLWLVRDVMKKGAVILEGDIYFRAPTLGKALDTMDGRSFYCAGRYYGKPDEVVIRTDSEKRILSVDVLRGGRALSGSDGTGPRHVYMSSGILTVQPEYGTELASWLSEEVDRDNVNVLFDDVLGLHATDLPLWVYEIGTDDWVEIDTKEDLLRAESIFL
jgi:choline kinase